MKLTKSNIDQHPTPTNATNKESFEKDILSNK
jgi:hypothetical protein